MASPQLNNVGLLVELKQTLQLVRCRFVLALLQSRSTSVRKRIAALNDGPESEAAREILKNSSDELDARMEVLRQQSALATEALERCLEDLRARAAALDTRCEDLRKLRGAKAIEPVAFFILLAARRGQHFALRVRSTGVRLALVPPSTSIKEARQVVVAVSAPFRSSIADYVQQVRGDGVAFANVVLCGPVFVWAFARTYVAARLSIETLHAITLSILIWLVGPALGIWAAYRAKKKQLPLGAPLFTMMLPLLAAIAGNQLGLQRVDDVFRTFTLRQPSLALYDYGPRQVCIEIYGLPEGAQFRPEVQGAGVVERCPRESIRRRCRKDGGYLATLQLLSFSTLTATLRQSSQAVFVIHYVYESAEWRRIAAEECP